MESFQLELFKLDSSYPFYIKNASLRRVFNNDVKYKRTDALSLKTMISSIMLHTCFHSSIRLLTPSFQCINMLFLLIKKAELLMYNHKKDTNFHKETQQRCTQNTGVIHVDIQNVIIENTTSRMRSKLHI